MTDTSTEAGAGAGPAVANTVPSVGPRGDGRTRVMKIVAATVAAAIALYIPHYFTSELNKVFSQAIFLAIAAMGLNLLTGFNGQVSIGHGAFFGIGAFTTGILMVDYGWYFEPTMIVAFLLAGVVGLIFGFPALRVKGLYLALITLGLAVLFPRVAAKYVSGQGGVSLLRPKRSEFDSPIAALEGDQYEYYLCLAIAILLFVLARNLMHSRIGRSMIAVRDQETAASTVGVNLAGVKVGTFALSAAYAGIAGSLSVMVNKIADATNPIAYFQLSIEFLVAVVIGGAATILGPAVGALVLTFLRRYTDGLIEGKEILSPAILGASLIALVYFLPAGLVGGFKQLFRKFSGGARPPVDPSDVSPDTSAATQAPKTESNSPNTTP